MESECDKLIKWLNTFELPKSVSSVADLNNGDVICHILTQLSPDHFNVEWSSKIKKEVSGDWRIKASNLKKILKRLLEYYKKNLSISISESHTPDVNAIAEEENAKEASKLLQLLLGCAVSCNNKEVHVEKIMELEEGLQHFVMLSIKEVMSCDSPQSSESDISRQGLGDSEAYKKLLKEKEEAVQKWVTLEKQLAGAVEERAHLKEENEHLTQQLHQQLCSEDLSSPLGRRLQATHKQLEQCQEELFKAETLRDDHKIRNEALEKEISQLRAKVECVEEMSKETRDLRDEVDILRHHADKTLKYEATINSLKKKIDEGGDLRAQMRFMEERNTCYIERNLELEEESKKVPQLRTQLEAYKKQLVELQLKASEQDKQLDKTEFELKRCRDKTNALTADKERLTEDNCSLREQNEELSALQSKHNAANAVLSSHNGLCNFTNVSPEIREEMLKLQHENRLLRGKGEEGEEGGPGEDLWKTLLSQSEKAKEELEVKLRTQNRKILELEAKIEDLSEKPYLTEITTTQPLATTTSHTNHTKHLVNSCDLKGQCKNNVDLLAEVERLRLVLRSKDEHIRNIECKYQNYLDKAKYIMQQERLQPPQPPVDVTCLQDQVIQKDKFIKALQNTIKINEAEQKLMLSAFYNLGIKSHKRRLEGRLHKDHTQAPPNHCQEDEPPSQQATQPTSPGKETLDKLPNKQASKQPNKQANKQVNKQANKQPPTHQSTTSLNSGSSQQSVSHPRDLPSQGRLPVKAIHSSTQASRIHHSSKHSSKSKIASATPSSSSSSMQDK